MHSLSERGGKNEIFDRLRTEIQDKQRVHIIYNVCTSKVDSDKQKTLTRIEQESLTGQTELQE